MRMFPGEDVVVICVVREPLSTSRVLCFATLWTLEATFENVPKEAPTHCYDVSLGCHHG